MIASPTTLIASHYFDALGIRNVYVGRYRRADGSVVQARACRTSIKREVA